MDFEKLLKGIRIIPVTSVVLLLGLAGYLLVFFHFDYRAFQIVPFSYLTGLTDYFRLFTPVFLHFSVMHIVFNSLWIWELGRRIEVYMGSVRYSGIFLITALGGNLFQLYSSGGNNFGGLSGVVYGYLGFVFIAKKAVKHPVFNVPEGLFVAMLVFLVLGYLGVLDFLAGGGVANGAHLGGLLSGLLCGLVYFHKELKNLLGGENANR